MKNYFKSSFVKFIVFSIFCMISAFQFPSAAHATIDSASTLQDLQTKLDSAMHSRQTSYSVNYSGNSTTLKTDITNTINSIYNADDYLKYTGNGYSYSYSTTSGVTTINFTFKYWNDSTQDAYVNTRVSEILSQIITSDMGDFEKQKKIHDWIVQNVAYDTTLKNHSDYAALIDPYKTVCQGYALLAYKLLNQAGIQTRIIDGTGDGQAHAWNLVNIDGAWYHFDATWDDSLSNYSYYNLTDAQIKADHSWTKASLSATTDFSTTLSTKLTSDSANSTIYQELYNALDLKLLTDEYTVNDATGLNAKIQDAIKKQQNKIRVRYMKGSTLATDITTAVKGISNITSYSYIKANCNRSSVLGDVILDLSFNYSTPISVSSVSLSNSDLTLSAGTTSTLTATVLPSNASNKTIIWTTSNASVATVTSGVVKAVGGGTATIIATTADGSFTATCNINVIQGVSSIVIASPSQYVRIGGDDITLAATVNPVGATDKSLTWKSSNTNVATVDSTGKVHAVAYGTAVISATSVQDPTKIGKYTVIVPVPPTGVTINSSSTVVKMGSTLALSTVISPTNATIKTVTWTSSNTNIAKVSATGIITPVAPGSVTITATTTDSNLTAIKDLTVIYGVNSVTLNKASTYIKLGADETLTATINPSNATDSSLVWKSSNTNIATVDSSGNVHATAYGTAVISATSVQDSTKVGKCTVTVPVPVTGVSINSSSNVVKMGSTLALSTVIAPTNATIKTVAWTSSDTNIAKVSSTGVVTPLALGQVTITAVTTDGSFTATKNLALIYGVTSVTLNKTSTSIQLGSDETLTATVNPSNATDNSLTWTSSNTNVATVDLNGNVYAAGYGTAVISATSVQDSTKIAKCTVTVPTPVTGVSINSSSNYVKLGSTLTLSATVSPTSATIKTITWTSSNTAIAKVSSTGVVTPVAPGSVTITATTTDGNFTVAKDLTVVYGVTSITLDKTSASLKLSASDMTLTATINPSNASDKSLVWKSSNTNIATVDPNGKVHAVATGTAVISATSVQDPTKIVKCTITITN